jgi:energy-coupling factor transporter ATP-binding protein EcfA2
MTGRTSGRSVNPHAIVRITVENLFGQFTYELPAQDDPSDVSSLMILYGDNGSGKTTILKTLFHLLAGEDGRGHKTYVSRVRFKRFSVELADGTVIEARRSGGRQEGAYTATILKGRESLESLDLPILPAAPDREEKARKLNNFLRILNGLDLGLHLLPDNRRIQGGGDDDPRHLPRNLLLQSVEIVQFFGSGEEPGSGEAKELRRAVARAERWIRAQAYEGSDTGQRNVNSIYTEVAKNIAGAPATGSAEIRRKLDDLVVQLRGLSERSADYARYGLLSELPVDRLTGSMSSDLSPESATILYNVISPYVSSVEAQLKALQGIHSLIDTLVRNLNKFFAGSKVVAFELGKGFTFTSAAGDRLDLDLLSSGEKQLLLLLCNTLAARDRVSILIIDEPEISLNIKWQRRLIQALLDCIQGSNVQLIFATHSIELLAQHKNHVVRLENQDARGTDARAEGGPDERRAEEDIRVGSEV